MRINVCKYSVLNSQILNKQISYLSPQILLIKLAKIPLIFGVFRSTKFILVSPGGLPVSSINSVHINIYIRTHIYFNCVLIV